MKHNTGQKIRGKEVKEMAVLLAVYLAQEAVMQARFHDWIQSMEAYKAAGKPEHLTAVVEDKADLLIEAVNKLTDTENAIIKMRKERA